MTTETKTDRDRALGLRLLADEIDDEVATARHLVEAGADQTPILDSLRRIDRLTDHLRKGD